MIRLSKLADYGIVVMSHLARQQDRPAATAEIASATGVPKPMTGKILKLLVRSGLLTSHRGVHGGYTLGRPAGEVTVTQIVEALDGPIALTSCVVAEPSDCGIESLCPARANWQRINDAIRLALSDISLAEMATSIPPVFMLGNERAAQGAATATMKSLEATSG